MACSSSAAISSGVGQMSVRYTGWPSSSVPSGSVARSMSTRAGQGVGHHQRRGGQVVGPHLGVDPALEVAVAREHAGHHQVALVDRLGHRLGQRAAVADAGGAAVAHHVEAELLQVGQQPGRVEVLGDHLGARRQAGLDPGLAPSGPRSTAFLASRPAASITDGLEVLVQLVMAAITTAPWPSRSSLPFSATLARAAGRCATLEAAAARAAPRRALAEARLHLLEGDPVLGPLAARPGSAPRCPGRARGSR